MRIGFGERFAFHGVIVAHQDLIAPTPREATQYDGLAEKPTLGNADDIREHGASTEQDAVQYNLLKDNEKESLTDQGSDQVTDQVTQQDNQLENIHYPAPPLRVAERLTWLVGRLQGELTLPGRPNSCNQHYRRMPAGETLALQIRDSRK